MPGPNVRMESDGMGTLEVPAAALWGAQTQRAVNNFQLSGLMLPRSFLRALGLIKWAAAQANGEVAGLDAAIATAIGAAALEVADGRHDREFPVDVFQTGSGTSTNMNANEVIATLATRQCGQAVHPNDHVNMSQSSNDVIPTTIHLAAALGVAEHLVPALEALRDTLDERIAEVGNVVKTGRTHLMDAVPLTLGQEMSGWRQQIDNGIERLLACEPRLHRLGLGGTAVGTGLNAPPAFAGRAVQLLGDRTGLALVTSPNYFESLAAQDAAVELSGQLKVLAVSLMKIANDLRWMNSGPLAGLGESRSGRDDRRAGDWQRRYRDGRGAVRQFPVERDAACDCVQPAPEHRAARQCCSSAGGQRHCRLHRERGAAWFSARAQSHPRNCLEPPHWL